MKKLILPLFFFIYSIASGQQISISGFTVKKELPANISEWKADAVNAVVQGSVQGAPLRNVKLVIQVRKGSSFVCGNTAQTTTLTDNLTLKTIRATDVVSVLGNCVLLPGQYSLCIQVSNAENRILGEQCRDFSVPNVNDETTYQPPSLVSPSNGTTLSLEDVKKPLTFRWTPVVPPVPNNDVVYRLRIYEVQKGQQPAQAIRSNSPVLEKTSSTTQTVWQVPVNLFAGKESKTFVWTIQATNRQGKPYGANNGTSEFSMFMITQGGCVATLTITKDSCIGPAENGLYRHRICATYTASPTNSSNILFNHPTNNTTNNFGMFQSGQSNIFASRTPGTFTTNFSPSLGSLPASLAPGASTSFCFDLLAPPSTAGVKFTAFGFCDDNSGNFNTANANDSIPLKRCVCDPCSELGVTLKDESLTSPGNGSHQVVLAGNLVGLNPNKIKKVTIELVYFTIEQTGDRECAKCAENKEWGNFVPPQSSFFTGFNTPFLNAASFGRMWTWNSSVQKDCGGNTDGSGNGSGQSGQVKSSTMNAAVVDVSNIKQNSFSLPIAVPPANALSCCGDKIKICIRYTWWDFCCKACDVIKCYEIERKPVK